jgi:thiamine-phosphate pyrophosphorylase
VASALQGGASVIQLRDKEAKDDDLVRQVLALLKITRAARVPLIINDRIEVALRSGADGVHLGQTDAGLGEARSCLGEKAIIGRSTHSPEQALLAQREGFDYIGVGPVFGTPTKPDVKPVGLDLVRFASQNIHIPFVAIGGIDLTNIADVLAAGARTVAVVRAVMRAADPEWAAERLVEKITLNDKQKAGCEGNLT